MDRGRLEIIPATILTGFLGSGKTTLLRRALSSIDFADTAVVINEVGEISIDHYLVDFVDGDVFELPGGCLCCAVREDLAQTLRSLIDRRDAGTIRPFRRLVVETSGLADPGPILYTLGADAMLDQRLRLQRVATVVDAVTGAATIERFAEAARQVAVADTLIVSKTDLVAFEERLVACLAALNPAAVRIMGTEISEPATVLFHPLPSPPPLAEEGEIARVRSPSLASGGGLGRGLPPPTPEHTHGIATFTMTFDAPIGRFEFARALGGLAQERGYDLLRVKGLVAFADAPARPAVVQAAQHTMYSPQWLDAWPDADRRSRLVFIVHDMAPGEILDRFAFAAPTFLGAPASSRQAGKMPAIPLSL